MSNDSVGEQGAARPLLKLLVIDDQPDQLALHCKKMEALGYVVKPLLWDDDARLGIVTNAVRAFKPDAVLTDWQLNPPMDGVKVAQSMKAICAAAGVTIIPVVLHTADKVAFEREYQNLQLPLLGVVEKGRHEEIDKLLSEHFQLHTQSAGAANDTKHTRGRG